MTRKQIKRLNRILKAKKRDLKLDKNGSIPIRGIDVVFLKGMV